MAAIRTALSAWRPRDRVRGAVAFLTQSQPPRPLSGWSLAADAVLAVAATVAAIVEVILRTETVVAAIPKEHHLHPGDHRRGRSAAGSSGTPEY